MKLRFAPQAIRQMEAISEYLEARNPGAALRIGTRVRETIDLLLKFPNMGHKGPQPGTREMLVPRLPYIIVYRIERDHGRTNGWQSLPFITALSTGPGNDNAAQNDGIKDGRGTC